MGQSAAGAMLERRRLSERMSFMAGETLNVGWMKSLHGLRQSEVMVDGLT